MFAGMATAGTFTYSDFSSTAGLSLTGAAAQSGTVLRLVPAVNSQAGDAWRTAAQTFDAHTSFSTSFEFNVTTNLGDPTDGFSFILQNDATGNAALGGAGQGSGYVGLSPSVAVLFRGRAPSFIGVVLNGVDPLPSLPPGATPRTEGDFYNSNFFAWIDYNATTTTLNVFLDPTSVKPLTPVLSNTVNIAGTLGGSQAFVGFGAGTGGANGTNDILKWSFSSVEVPEPGTAGFLAMSLIALGFARRGFKR